MAEEQQQQRNPVSVTVKCQYQTEGAPAFGFDLTAECLVEHIPGLLRKLAGVGVTPAQTPYTWDSQQTAQNPPQQATQGFQAAPQGQAPLCPVHGVQMAVSKFGGWYCKAKVGVGPDGKGVYCQEKVAG